MQKIERAHSKRNLPRFDDFVSEYSLQHGIVKGFAGSGDQLGRELCNRQWFFRSFQFVGSLKFYGH